MKKSEREEQKKEAVDYLRSILPAGSTVSLVLASVSRSGMSRNIKCLATFVDTDANGENPTARQSDISFFVARATGNRLIDGFSRSVQIYGCGMDMGLALIDDLSYAVYGKPCPQKSNGGGEGINYRWL